MARFCTKCGTPLNENGQCPKCPTEQPKVTGFKAFINGMKKRMGIGWDGEDALNVFERNLKIVPEVVVPNEGEIPVKQYNIATLRSRILQKYSEGRMQITNKRLIFRASGPSISGRMVIHHEFTVNEIAGIEIKKSNRLSGLSLIVALLLSVAIGIMAEDVFTVFVENSTVVASIIGYISALALLVPFFLVKGKFWLKLLGTAAATGIMSALSTFSLKGLILGETLLNLHNILYLGFTVIWLFNMILVSFVPDLKICIKTNSAGDAIQIRRKQWGFGRKQTEEYTGFSEVLPWIDTEKAAKELGAIIDDIQTVGDLAIDKWKEK